MKIANLAAYAFATAAGIFLGRVELHSDDTGVEAVLLLAVTFILGCWRPRNAWQWALIVGVCIPGAQLLFGSVQPRQAAASMLQMFGFVLVVGLAGSYAGVLARKMLRAATTPISRSR